MSMVIMLVAVFIVFYFLVIRPENKKKSEEMHKSVIQNEEVVGSIVEFGKEAYNAGKKATQVIGKSISESNNETIVKARNFVGAVKNP